MADPHMHDPLTVERLAEALKPVYRYPDMDATARRTAASLGVAPPSRPMACPPEWAAMLLPAITECATRLGEAIAARNVIHVTAETCALSVLLHDNMAQFGVRLGPVLAAAGDPPLDSTPVGGGIPKIVEALKAQGWEP